MNTSNRPNRSLRLLLILTLGLLTGHAATKAPAPKDLLLDLRKSLVAPAGTPPNPALPNANRYVDQVDLQLTQLRFAEAEQMLAQLRTVVPADNTKAFELIDELLADVRAQVTEATAKQDAAYSAVEADFVKKFEAKAPAADYDTLLKHLATLPPVASSNYNNPNAQKIESLRSFITRWQDYLLQSASGNPQQAASALNEVVQLSARLPIVPRSQLAKLQSDTNAALNSRTASVDPRWEALRTKLAGLIDTAKSPSDFDGLMAELAKSGQNNSNGYPGNASMEALRRMAVRWQDYFSQLEAGNGPAAQNVLRELSNDPTIDLYYPRSKVLVRLNGKISAALPDLDATDPLIAPEKLTLDNLDQFARQLSARRSANALTGVDFLIAEVSRLQAVAQQLKFGNPQAALVQLNLQTGATQPGSYAAPLAAIQQALLLKAVPGLLEAPKDDRPQAEDSVESYVARLLRHGRDQKDWPLVYRCLSFETRLVRPGFTTDKPDLQAYRSFFTALQQEKAGQWTMAARSYFAALKTVSPNLPTEEIGLRLAQLKQDHPDDYAAAEKFPNGEPTYGSPFPIPVRAISSSGQVMDPRAMIQAGIVPPGYTVDPKTGRIIPESLPIPPAKEPVPAAPTTPIPPVAAPAEPPKPAVPAPAPAAQK